MTDCTIVSEHLHDEKPEELISLMEKLHGREDINRMIEAVEDERLSIEDVFSVALENKTKAGFLQLGFWKSCVRKILFMHYILSMNCAKSLTAFAIRVA